MIYFIIVVGTFIPSVFVIPGFDNRITAPFQEGNQTSAIQYIDAAIAADQANNRQTVTTMIEEAMKEIEQLEDGLIRSLWAKIVIVIFSVGALSAILYKLWRRSRELKEYSLRVFRYLVVREAYNIVRRTIAPTDKISGSEIIDKGLQAVEQYLTNGDWALARITVDQITLDYYNLLVERVIGKGPIIRDRDTHPT
jgi:hypothetical protein